MSLPQPKRVAIVGAGLAGAACANVFARQGYQVTLYEQAAKPAAGASGVPIALFAPSVSADDAPHSRLLRRGVHLLHGELERLTQEGFLNEDTDWALTGLTEHLNLDPARRSTKRLPASWQKPMDPPHLQSRMAIDAQGIFHPYAGWVKPDRLIAAWLSHPSIRFVSHTVIEDVTSLLTADVSLVVLCAGYQSTALTKVVLQPVRGQLEFGELTDVGNAAKALPDKPCNGAGHFVKSKDTWLMGASFQRNESDQIPREKDTAHNFAKFKMLLPTVDSAPLQAAAKSWVGVRATTKNRLPLVMQASAREPRLWVCAGLGSRGLSLAALCAQELLSFIRNADKQIRISS